MNTQQDEVRGPFQHLRPKPVDLTSQIREAVVFDVLGICHKKTFRMLDVRSFCLFGVSCHQAIWTIQEGVPWKRHGMSRGVVSVRWPSYHISAKQLGKLCARIPQALC